jgi:hypothetical protein
MPTHPPTPPRRLASLALAAALPLLLAACRDDSVVAYDVPKEKTAPPPAAAAGEKPAADPHASLGVSLPAAANASMAGTPVATAAGPGLAWTAPAHWQAKAGSAMRKGSYAVPGEAGATGDLAITAFPGDVGGEIANVNRWRGQVGLTPLDDAASLAAITRLEANGLKIGVVDVTGPDGGARLLGAMVPFENATWFFKLTGPDALVAKEKPAFLAFLKTVKSATPTAP